MQNVFDFVKSRSSSPTSTKHCWTKFGPNPYLIHPLWNDPPFRPAPIFPLDDGEMILPVLNYGTGCSSPLFRSDPSF
jgi:hypothetical protein